MRLTNALAYLAIAACVTTPAQSQETQDTPRCSDTLKRLDRELSALAARIDTSRDSTARTVASSQPPARVLAELSDMTALQAHLRCMSDLADEK